MSQKSSFSNTQTAALGVAQACIFIFSGLLAVILSINVYIYLLRNKRYRDPSILLFYINAFLIIIAVVVETANISEKHSICPFSIIIDNYYSHSLNLNLGICQACMLTTLSVKLNQILGTCGLVDSIEQTEEFAYEQLTLMYQRLGKVKMMAVSFNVSVFIITIIGQLWMISTVQAEGGRRKCLQHEHFEDKAVAVTYSALFLVVGMMIVFWICYQVVTIVHVLDQQENKECLVKEKWTVVTIASVFILAYSFSSLYLIYDLTIDPMDSFWNRFFRMSLQAMSNFLPITCVLFTHMKNVSASKFIKTALLSLIAKREVSMEKSFQQSDDRATVVNNEMLLLISEMSGEDDLNASNILQLQRLSSNLRLIISNTSGHNLLTSNSPTFSPAVRRSHTVFSSVAKEPDMRISVSSTIQEEEFEMNEEHTSQLKKSKTIVLSGSWPISQDENK